MIFKVFSNINDSMILMEMEVVLRWMLCGTLIVDQQWMFYLFAGILQVILMNSTQFHFSVRLSNDSQMLLLKKYY